MKKLLLFLIIAVFVNTSVNAQYSINKTKYNYRTYSYQIGDPYNPSVAGLTSFLIPGLGQMLSGEGGRGLGFLGGYLGCAVIYGVGVASAINDIDNGGTGSAGAGTMVVGVLGMVVIDIWSIVDAVQVAKVNNLVFRDKNKTSYNLQIQPYFNTTYYSQTGSIPTGVTLKVRF
ncbi:MAG TPA: hypothetical protein VMV77_13755 [Bacteroidales bacterium]|nr:hypothetical protein [Bacteroidales bacterium]